jgi:hypothetical protein
VVIITRRKGSIIPNLMNVKKCTESYGLIYEIKPDNPRQIQRGRGQLRDYQNLLKQVEIFVTFGTGRYAGTSSATPVKVEGCGDLSWKATDDGLILYTWRDERDETRNRVPVVEGAIIGGALALELVFGMSGGGAPPVPPPPTSTLGSVLESAAGVAGTLKTIAAAFGFWVTHSILLDQFLPPDLENPRGA